MNQELKQVLTPEEVEALQNAISSGQVDTEEDTGGVPEDYSRYDFSRFQINSVMNLPALSRVCDRFVKVLKATLLTRFNISFSISSGSPEAMRFQEFLSGLADPTCIILFSLDPPGEHAVMTIDARQAHFFVDRLCGGHGPVTGNEDVIEFKEIGQSLVKRVAFYLLDDLERAWEPIFPLKTTFKSLHFNPNYFEAAAPYGFQGGGVGVISMEVKSEHSQGKLNLCFSRSTLQQLLGNGGKKDAEEPPHIEKALTERLKKCLSEVSVNVSVELGKGTLTFREFLSLKEGDVIHLDNGTTKEVLLRVEGIDKFRGNPGRYLNQRAIKIVSSLKNGGR